MEKTSESGYRIILFGLVMMINFPLFGILWKVQNFQLNQEFFLRMTATGLCALLVSHKFWSESWLKCLPILWYITLIYCLPFFFTYLTLLNHGATLWLMNCMSAIFFLFLVTSALASIVILSLGIGLAFLCFLCNPANLMIYIPGSISSLGLSITTIAAIIIGALFARDRELFLSSKISGLRLLAGTLAHDIRTPLANIYLQTRAQERVAEEINNPDARKSLYESIHKIEHCIDGVNQLISMQLNNIQREKLDTRQFGIFSISLLIKKALEDYPFKNEEKDKVHVNFSPNFLIWVDEGGFRNLMWNLLKNALDFIKETGKGEIFLWLKEGGGSDNFNYLHVKDTSKGIPPEKANLIFESFYSEKSGGTGIGLAYCKLFMKTAGGEIICEGKLSEYTHFIIKFPKVD